MLTAKPNLSILQKYFHSIHQTAQSLMCMLNLFHPEIVFSQFHFCQPFFSLTNRVKVKPPTNVCLSCLLFHLPMNEIIISHEKFSSENKNIIGTSIFITDKTFRNNFHLNFAAFKEALLAARSLGLCWSEQTLKRKAFYCRETFIILLLGTYY